jgi:hypothetical protein
MIRIKCPKCGRLIGWPVLVAEIIVTMTDAEKYVVAGVGP